MKPRKTKTGEKQMKPKYRFYQVTFLGRCLDGDGPSKIYSRSIKAEDETHAMNIVGILYSVVVFITISVQS